MGHVTAPGMVHLGFEVGTGAPVAIPLRHMVVTGQTQEAGKTTTLEALIARSGLRAVTFVTKRGEGAFAGGQRLQPFFRERADWVFVSSLIDATLGEKNKLLRAWLMKVCRGTKTLAEVQRNVVAAKEKARGFSESIYTEIEGYLELVVPQLAQLPPARKVEIGAGLNVMDLARYSTELQALVIRSVLEHVYEHEDGVVTVIPEAWEFLPEGRGSPVKREAEALIRKGAGLKNYVWLDSQDLAGVWKTAVRAAPVVLIGVQREANEIKRTLANIPAGIAKPSASAVARLQLGEFFACWGQHTIKTYVQPAWATDEKARAVALGDNALPPRPAAVQTSAARMDGLFAKAEHTYPEDDPVNQQEADALRAKNTQLIEENEELRRRIEQIERRVPDPRGDRPETEQRPKKDTARAAAPPVSELLVGEDLYQAIKARLVAEAPAILKTLVAKPELRVEVERQQVEAKGDTLFGRVAILISEGFFDEGATGNAAFEELKRRGIGSAKPNVYRECDRLTTLGFLVKTSDGYKAVTGMKVQIVDPAA